MRCGALRTGLVSFVLCLAALAAAPTRAAGEDIRVLIADNRQMVTIEASRGFTGDAAGTGSPARRVIRAASVPRGRVSRFVSRTGVLRVNGRSYRGTVELRRKAGGKLMVVNDLDIEDYLKGVIPAEIPFDWEEEALKAQAVASRSYALYQKRKAGNRPYHVLATVDSQMYLGKSAERGPSSRAVESTRGLVVTYAGEIIPAFYHASCGGHTEDAAALWGLDEPYLKGVDCDCQEISRYGLWERRFRLPVVEAALRRHGYRISGITGVEIGAMTAAGRVKNVVFLHAGGRTSVPSEALRAALGYSRIPSIFFEPELAGGELVFSGRGLGHGVGLCQWGAKTLARRGFDFRAILEYYYPGTTVAHLPQ